VRAVLFAGDEPLYIPQYLEPILESHADAFEAVVVAPPDRPLAEQVRRQFRMFGPRNFARVGAMYLRGRVLNMLDAVGWLGRRLTGRYHSVERLAAAHGLPVWRTRDVNDPGFVDRVRSLDPDLLLSVVAGQKLGPGLLSIPEDAINLHGSLLPKYRGRAVAFWPLYYGDDETGVTAHLMTAEWDAGPIVAQRSFPIRDDGAMQASTCASRTPARTWPATCSSATRPSSRRARTRPHQGTTTRCRRTQSGRRSDPVATPSVDVTRS
jgi:hypothetical protein